MKAAFARYAPMHLRTWQTLWTPPTKRNQSSATPRTNQLFEELFRMSKEKHNLNSMICEWYPTYVYKDKENRHCLCGQQIVEICVIQNKHTGREAEVGNHCILKFEGENKEFENVPKIFHGLKRVNKNKTSSFGKSLRTYTPTKKPTLFWLTFCFPKFIRQGSDCTCASSQLDRRVWIQVLQRHFPRTIQKFKQKAGVFVYANAHSANRPAAYS